MLAKVGLVNQEGPSAASDIWVGEPCKQDTSQYHEACSCFHAVEPCVVAGAAWELPLAPCCSTCEGLLADPLACLKIAANIHASIVSSETLAQDNGLERSSLTGTMAGQDEPVRNPWVCIDLS